MNPPVTIEEIKLLHLIYFHGSITKAAADAGMSQSSLSKKLTVVEEKLGTSFFKRSTRSLTITASGLRFLEETANIPKTIDSAVQNLTQRSKLCPQKLKLDLSLSLASGHIPGFIRKQEQIENLHIQVAQHNQQSIIKRLLTNQTDLAILPYTHELDKVARIHQQVNDHFTLIINSSNQPPSLKHLNTWAAQQNWILPSTEDITYHQILSWLRQLNIECKPNMEIPNFDSITHLVALGHGVAIVPKRSVSLFYNKKRIQPVSLPIPLTRQLTLVSPIQAERTANIAQFLDTILFS